MPVIDHIFENIDTAWDYIYVEEQEKLSNGTWGCPLNVSRFPGIPSPIVNPDDIKHLIIPYNDLAYPYSGFFNNASSDKFILCRLKSGRYSLKPNLKYRKFLFRGQPKGYATCKPSLFRDEKVKYYIKEMMRSQELQLLMLNHPLVQLLDVGVMLNGQKIAFEMNTYGLTQHYYNKTSFLDLTSSEEVASFFA
ncbi:MAG: FRG domain-containing protein, partial [Bacteroidaceae bacterium]|nr:FRG domain-containing protein [Bacteroidaceae bacterium]